MDQTRPAQRRARSLASAAVAALVLAAGAALGAAPAAADKPAAGHCARIDKVVVKGAERTETACLDDLTTTGTVQSGHTNPADWAGLHAAGTVTPSGCPASRSTATSPTPRPPTPTTAGTTTPSS